MRSSDLILLASASHSDWEQRPGGWMDEWQEVLRAIEQGFSLATSPWAAECAVCSGLCAPMSLSVCMALLTCERKKRKKNNSHVEICAAAACSCLWVYATHMVEDRAGVREDRKRDRWIASPRFAANNEEESPAMRIRVNLPFCHRPRQRAHAVRRSERFLPDGCETLLHPSNTSWQQRLHHYWFPFLLYLEKHGSHARRRHRNKIRLPLLITALLRCTRRQEDSLGTDPL